jgi:DNA polymerase-3 subunit epsilon
MTLQLERPLVVFDLETTGKFPADDRIVEICCLKLDPDGGRDLRTRRLNPGRPIPAGASAVHGIHDADVAGEPHFAQIAASLADYLTGCDLAGYNCDSYDIPLLAAEFARVDIPFPGEDVRTVDAMAIYLAREPRTSPADKRRLDEAVSFYAGREHSDSHAAEADAVAVLDVLHGQLSRYNDLPRTVDGLSAWVRAAFADSGRLFRWAGGVPVLTLGKHLGRPLGEVAAEHPDYLEWLLGADFAEDTRAIAREALAGRLPEAP